MDQALHKVDLVLISHLLRQIQSMLALVTEVRRVVHV
jgi:hypothetical protein